MGYLRIEISDKTAAALTDLAQLDEADGVEMLNRTTLINRAVQVWHVIRVHEQAGGQVIFRDADGTMSTARFE